MTQVAAEACTGVGAVQEHSSRTCSRGRGRPDSVQRALPLRGRRLIGPGAFSIGSGHSRSAKALQWMLHRIRIWDSRP